MKQYHRWFIGLLLVIVLFVVLPFVSKQLSLTEALIVFAAGIFCWPYTYLLERNAKKNQRQWYYLLLLIPLAFVALLTLYSVIPVELGDNLFILLVFSFELTLSFPKDIR